MLCNILKVDPAAYAGVELPFADADQIPSWSVNYIKALYALGYTGGSLGGDGLLYSNYGSNITRQEIAVLLGQFLPAVEGLELTFTDADRIPAWALPGMTTAVGYGLLGGDPDGTILSTNPATRAEVAVILCNFQPLLAQAQAGTLVPPSFEPEPGTESEQGEDVQAEAGTDAPSPDQCGQEGSQGQPDGGSAA